MPQVKLKIKSFNHGPQLSQSNLDLTRMNYSKYMIVIRMFTIQKRDAEKFGNTQQQELLRELRALS